MIFEVYDIEVLKNCFTYTGYNLNEKKWYQYVIHESRNDLLDLKNHLRIKNLCMIGFNNEKYDYPIIHHILNHPEYDTEHVRRIVNYIYAKSQEVIDMEFSAIADKNKFIPQIDLFLIHHYSNAARRTSLKALEVQMHMKNIEEMPFDHTHECTSEDVEKILAYNKNDVIATVKFFLTTIGNTDYSIYKGKNKLDLRIKLRDKFEIPCLNYPDVKIGEELILKLYCDRTGKKPWDVRQMRTKRPLIYLKDCIPSWAVFKTPEFQELKQKFANTVITKIKGEFDASLIYHSIQMFYGTGGVHSSAEPQIFESNDDYIIVDEDIGSLYPSLAIQLGLYPEHLGPVFTEIYNEIVTTRLNEKKKPKKERDMVIMEGYKLAANGII